MILPTFFTFFCRSRRNALQSLALGTNLSFGSFPKLFDRALLSTAFAKLECLLKCKESSIVKRFPIKESLARSLTICFPFSKNKKLFFFTKTLLVPVL